MNNPQRSFRRRKLHFQQMLKKWLAMKVLKFATALMSKIYRAASDWEDAVIYEEDLDHFCGKCKSKLDIVRPGKYQRPKCE